MRDENPQLTDDEHTHNIHHRRGYVRRYHSNAAPDTGVRRIQYEALLPAS